MTKNKTILIVDDVRLNTILLKQMLDATAYNAIAVNSGKEALDFLEGNQADLVLLDIMMPVMNGYEVLSEIRNNPDIKDIPVVVISAYSSQKDVDMAMSKGANDYLSKPVDNDDLLDMVAKYLD